jgi:hypothetical protein
VAPDDDFGVVDGVAGLVAPGFEEGAGLGAGIAVEQAVEQAVEPDLVVFGIAAVAVGLGAIVNSLVIAAAVGGDVAGLAGMGVAEARWGEVLWMGWAECHGASGSPHYFPSRLRMALQAFNVNDVMPVSVYTLYG